MRLLWLMVIVSFLWVSTHELVAHASPCTCGAGCADRHRGEESNPGHAADKDNDHHDCDSHGHFRGAVSAPAKPMIKNFVMPGLPVAFDLIGIYPREHLLLPQRWVLRSPPQDLPRYLSAQSLLL
jgi:hypothetical protein